LMPHPERATEPLMGSSDGLVIFESMLRVVQAARPSLAPVGKR
jgi:phosphoribosylformylglycinamidine (FGAM) synthase-like amidotransferase family enzyme